MSYRCFCELIFPLRVFFVVAFSAGESRRAARRADGSGWARYCPWATHTNENLICPEVMLQSLRVGVAWRTGSELDPLVSNRFSVWTAVFHRGLKNTTTTHTQTHTHTHTHTYMSVWHVWTVFQWTSSVGPGIKTKIWQLQASSSGGGTTRCFVSVVTDVYVVFMFYCKNMRFITDGQKRNYGRETNLLWFYKSCQ